MPYLEVIKGKEDEEQNKNEVEVPDVIGKTINEAGNILKERGLEMEITNNSDEEIKKDEVIVNSQIPSYGIKIYEGSHVYVEH